jgi:phage pi2 protein 07
MTIAKEQVIEDSEKYAAYCNRFDKNFAEGSSIIQKMHHVKKDLNSSHYLFGHLKKMEHAIPDKAVLTDQLLELENEYRVNKIEFNELMKKYQQFRSDSEISIFFAKPKEIKAPTIESHGTFHYPIVSHRLKFIIQYLSDHEDATLEKATVYSGAKMKELGGIDRYTQELGTRVPEIERQNNRSFSSVVSIS